MLTSCRTLTADPELIMSDEPADGLVPLSFSGSVIARLAEAGVFTFLLE